MARLIQPVIRQSRYFRRASTKFQLYLAATVANLTLVAGRIGLSGRTGSGSSSWGTARTEAVPSALHFLPAPFGQLLTQALLTLSLLLKYISPTKAFPPDF